MYNLAGYDFTSNIHLYKFEELNILLDVNSGAIHVLDDMAYAYINWIIQYEGDFYRAFENCTIRYGEETAMKIAEEFIIAYENESLFSEPMELFVDYTQMSVKALCLNVAHLCNMRCQYCFASQGNFGQKPALMTYEVGQQALDFLVKESCGVRNLEVDFFGGEPLLNFTVVKELVNYARSIEKQTDKIFNFTLTTNGLLLDKEIMDFLIQENISVILSLDGRKEINDQNRLLTTGKGSYEIIVPKFKQIVAKNPISYYIRGTFTRQNLNFSQDLAHMVDLGFKNLSLEPAVGAGDDFAIKAEDLPQVLKEYERLTNKLWAYYQAGQEIHFFHYNLNLQKGPCLAKRQTGCGAGVEYVVITPEGDIYPCHQFVGEEEYYMGKVSEMSINSEIKNIFAQNTLVDKAECLKCWARNFCGGGCHANNLKANGNLKFPDRVSCSMHKKRIEGAIYLDLAKKIAG